jgi:hypothetical protein
MRKSKFTESQIVAILAEGGSGLGVGDVCRKHGANDHAICAEQLIDGEKTNDSRDCRMSAVEAWANAPKKGQSGHPTGVRSMKMINQKNIISSDELLSINSRF